MMQLSSHFSLEELTFSSTAQRKGIDNSAPPDVVEHLRVLASNLESVRTALGGRPIHIDSGYRCAALNEAVGGVATSAHLTGYAADILCPDYGTPLQIALRISQTTLPFDQVIMEGTWVHVSFDPQARRQCLTASFVPGGPTTYASGIFGK